RFGIQRALYATRKSPDGATSFCQPWKENSVSDSARPDLEALDELEQLIRSLADEMAAWRRRAHEAEARLRTVDERTAQTAAGKPSPEMAALARENQELKQRLRGQSSGPGNCSTA